MPDSNAKHTIETIYSAEDIHTRLGVLAAEIVAKEPQNLLVVPILKGSFVFAADLLRALYAAGGSPPADWVQRAAAAAAGVQLPKRERWLPDRRGHRRFRSGRFRKACPIADADSEVRASRRTFA